MLNQFKYTRKSSDNAHALKRVTTTTARLH